MKRIGNLVASSATLLTVLGVSCPSAFAQAYAPAVGTTTPMPATTAGTAECIPQCRAGYLCRQGQCVSACNPPCAANETCNNGQCFAAAPPGPAPAVAPYAAAQVAPSTAPGQPGTIILQPAGYPAKAPAAKGVRTHDGFYLRMGLGFGALSGSTKPDGSTVSNDCSGFSEQIEFAMGGTPAPGFVIGGGVFASVTGSPSYSITLSGQSASGSGGSIMAEIVGPFIDVYPNPNGGFHLEAAVGPAVVAIAKGDNQQVCVSAGCYTVTMPGTPYSGVGFGFVGGVGYEAFVSDQWSIGGIARVMYASASLTPDDTVNYAKASVTAIMPGLLFGATYH